MKKLIIIPILISAVCLNAKTFIREYTYNASDADSKLSSRTIALEEVQRLLLQEIGVYVHSTIQNETMEISGELKELTSKQVEVMTAGVTQTKILEEQWNGEIYYIKAEIDVDEDEVLKNIDAVLKDEEKTAQLEESNKKTEEALKEIERLKGELAETKDEMERVKLKEEYTKTSNQLSAEGFVKNGHTAFISGNNENAIALYKKALELSSEDERIYYNIGLIVLRQKKIDKAMEFFEKAIRSNPKFIRAYLGIAGIYLLKKDIEKAREYYLTAMRIDPDNALIYFSLGKVYNLSGKYGKAIVSLLKAIELDPRLLKAYSQLSFSYYMLKKYENCIKLSEKAIEINPRFGEAYFNIGSAYKAQGQMKKAREYFKRAEQLGFKPEKRDQIKELGKERK